MHLREERSTTVAMDLMDVFHREGLGAKPRL
jgi:hypothetical protein